MDQKCINLEGKMLGYEKKTLAIVAVVIAVALVAFYAGAKYEKHKLGALGLIVNKSAKKAATGNSIKGTVTAASDKNVTIKMADGNVKTIEFSNGMTFGKDASDNSSSLFVNELVVITGENDATGNFIPTNIRASKNSPAAPANTTPEATATAPITTPAPASSAAKTMPAPVAK